MKLPAELRNHIYSFVNEAESHYAINVPNRWSVMRNTLPHPRALSNACRQLYLETYMQPHNFIVECGTSDLGQIADEVYEDDVTRCPSLRVSYTEDYEWDQDINLEVWPPCMHDISGVCNGLSPRSHD
jgi:hypothetical protein